MVDVNWAFFAVLEDIIAKNRRQKSVVLYARNSISRWTVDTSLRSNLPTFWRSVFDLLVSLQNYGISVVVSAGNDGKSSQNIDTLPALWQSQHGMVLNVVGAVTAQGAIAEISKGPRSGQLVSKILWAPGEDIVCAYGPTSQGFALATGTSSSAAMVPIPTNNSQVVKVHY